MFMQASTIMYVAIITYYSWTRHFGVVGGSSYYGHPYLYDREVIRIVLPKVLALED